MTAQLLRFPKRATSGYRIVCADFISKPYRSREQAERVVSSIESAGNCGYHHEIEEVGE